MDLTHPSAVPALCAAAQANSAVVTYVWSKLQAQFGKLGVADPMRGFLSYGSLRIERSDSDPMVILPHSRWALLPLSQALAKATLDTHTSGVPVLLVFANTSWRLLIASQTVTTLDPADGGSFGSLARESTRVLLARLYAQPHVADSPALRAWHATVPAADDAQMSSFLSTALMFALPISTPASAEFLSEQLHEDWDRPPPEEDEQPPDDVT